MHACMCVFFCAHRPVCVSVCAFVCMCTPSVLPGRQEGGWGGVRWVENDLGPIHMKQEGSYINIAPRPRGQAIYEANCSPVSHGGRSVYYAWGLVTCFKATPKTGWLGQWWWGVSFLYRCGILSCEKYVVGGEQIIALLCGAVVWCTGDAAWKAKYD